MLIFQNVVCIYMHVPTGPWLYIVSGFIYRQWLYIVLEDSRSPSPHKTISHHVDCEHCVLDYL